MQDIAFFDANCQIGRYNYRLEGAPYALKELVSDMLDHGIARRLVHHAMAKENSVEVGNRRLMQELADHEDLLPCWAVSTWATGETAPPGDLMGELKDRGVRAARFFRNAYRCRWRSGLWALSGRSWNRTGYRCFWMWVTGGRRWTRSTQTRSTNSVILTLACQSCS